MKEGDEEIGVMNFNANGLRDMANSMENLYGSPKVIIKMPIWKWNGKLYMQCEKGSGFIHLVKEKQEINTIITTKDYTNKRE